MSICERVRPCFLALTMLLVSILTAASPSMAGSICSGRSGKAWDACVMDLASWECRGSSSVAALKSCFLRIIAATEIQDQRTLHYVQPLVCYINKQDKPGQVGGTVKHCTDSAEGKGAGIEECYRTGRETIKICLYEDENAKPRCRSKTCPVGRSNCGCVGTLHQ